MSESSSQPSYEPGAEIEGFPEVFGKYVLMRPLARGGMGELYLAAHGDTGGFEKLCVVKKVLANLDDVGVHRRFLDEAKVVVRLNHSNLVQVFDAGKVDNEYYLAMELVEGKDLRAVWNRCAQLHRRIPVDIAIFTIRELTRGLSYAHDAMGLDLVHRDISPPNILLGYHGEVKLTDFGLAKSAIKREMTNPGVVFGRYSYLSPEQAKGLPADRRTDIYAAAIVLWELLTGRQLFPSHNRSHQDALAAVRDPTVKPPSEVVPGVPPGLDDIVLAALAPDREERYSTAGEFRAALSEILARHFPACDADRASDFMRDIFARERKIEGNEYAKWSREDFSEVRAAADEEQRTLSISDVIQVAEDAIELGDSDIVELDEPGAHMPVDASSLRESAQQWVGQHVARKYEIDRLIGIGGMGAVFRATHVALGKAFALKVLHRHYTRDPDLIQRFMREARAATQTGHPNIIDVVDIGTTERGDVYFVMELLEGRDLGHVIGRDGPFAARRAVHICAQVCRALGAAHGVGIIHRDLKSENIFLTPRGKDPDFVKVLDFGICKTIDADSSQTTPGLVMGSPDYMAPEQAAGNEATVAADVYAVGCILFEMLTGRLPYEGRNAIDVLMQKSARDAPRVATVREGIPEALSDVVARCLSRDADSRPPSMRVLEYELTRVVDGRASAVAAVLGLSMPREGGATDQSASSSSMHRAVVDTGSADGAMSLADARNASSDSHAPVPGLALPDAKPSGAAAGLKALLFVGLGGALVAGAVFALAPQAVDNLAPSLGESGTDTAAAAPDQKAERGVVPAPPPEPEPEPEPEAADGPSDPEAEAKAQVEALVTKAQDAFAEKHFREPAAGSLALHLTSLALLDPGHEAITRLRKDTEAVLLPDGERLVRKKQWKEAADTLRDLVAVWPDNVAARELLAEALQNQGRIILKLEDYDQALVTADEWLNIQPESHSALVLRAEALRGLERYVEARDTYEKALEQRPKAKKLKKAFRIMKFKARKAEERAAKEAAAADSAPAPSEPSDKEDDGGQNK